jgi:hypothetical protein
MSLFDEYVSLILDTVLISGFGWLLLVWVLIYMIYTLKKMKNQDKVGAAVEWVFLEVKIDNLNEKSPLAMEQIFASLHAIHQNFTWGEIYNGKSVLYLSCEIVSIGGTVSYIFKIPKRYRTLFESALFAQYPKAEIVETEDYLRNLPHYYDPETADFEFWGTQWLKKKDNAYPIRTYVQVDSFEHSAQETFIEPLSNVLEVMSNIQPYELVAYQLVIRPVNDDWKKHTKHLLDELKGVPAHHSDSLFLKILFFIPDLVADILVTHVLGVEKGEAHAAPAKDEPPSQMMHKSDIEKMVISSIERAMGKIGYEVRMRTLYLAPKDKFSGSRKAEIVGAFRNFDEVNLNGIKPDIGHTWTDAAYKISEKLEAPYLRQNVLTRKRHFLHNFVPRSAWRGSGKMIMNTEELATIFHFPQTQHSRVSQVGKVEAVKSAPPMDLPIGEL